MDNADLGSDMTGRTIVEWNKKVGGRVDCSSPTDQAILESAKPGFYVRVRRILQAEYLARTAGGIVVLAGLVNTVKLLCTAGFPASRMVIPARTPIEPLDSFV